jgi:NAD(P)-dependent dehydrogenase (short-subunit alcohol dehydrogenase family)
LVTVEVLVTGGRANIGLATTRQLLEELAVRMEHTQNSPAGRDLGRMCLDAIDNLATTVLNYRPPNRLAGGTA